jgi:hypothetical protein
VLDAQPKITLSVKRPKNGSSVSRVVGKVAIPIMDTVDTTLKTSEALGTFEFVLPKNSSSTVRLDLRKHIDTMLTNAIITAAVTDIESIY